MPTENTTRVLVLINQRSGLAHSFGTMRQAFDRHWESTNVGVFYQFTLSKEDGERKAQSAVAHGFDTILVAGGDGTINTIGRVLVGTDVAIGVIPTGSGNGFARHFGIPLSVPDAIRALANARVMNIDVGEVNDMTFFVTCSMAWDAAIVRSFERYPVRGIVPYILAGVQEWFEYEPQDMTVRIDGAHETVFERPIVFTIANLTQFGGGARIAPNAKARDGKLELVVGLKRDAAKLVTNLGRLFDGTLNRLPELKSFSFKSLTIHREKASPIQLDGELIETTADITINVKPSCLRVLVPGNG